MLKIKRQSRGTIILPLPEPICIHLETLVTILKILDPLTKLDQVTDHNSNLRVGIYFKLWITLREVSAIYSKSI